MKTYLVVILLAAVCSAFVAVNNAADQIPYPEGYHKWTNTRTFITGYENKEPKKGDGFHDTYANDRAMIGYQTGHFPDGAILVFDVRTAVTTEGTIAPGTRKHVDLMLKDSARFKDTGGWGFEEFTGDSRTEGRLSGERQKNCFNCHAGKKQTDFVFSQFKE
jgi:hypothetical protein